MRCHEARQLLEVCRPGAPELNDSELAEAVAHLEDCPACLAAFRAQERADELIGQAMSQVPIPPGLRERVRAELAAASAQSAGRGSRRRWLATVAAVAASVAFLLWLWPGRTEPPVQLRAEGVAETLAQMPLPEVERVPERIVSERERRQWCQRQLERQGPSGARLPELSVLVGLAGLGQVQLAGKPVPVVRFEDPRGPAPADLFILAASTFKLSGLDGTPRTLYHTGPVVVVGWSEPSCQYMTVLRGWVPEPWRDRAPQPPLVLRWLQRRIKPGRSAAALPARLPQLPACFASGLWQRRQVHRYSTQPGTRELARGSAGAWARAAAL